MQPSNVYESTEVTVNGFKYKKTNATVADIFTLNSSIDNSIAYTEPLIGDFSDVSMWGWKNTSSAYYIQKSLVWGRSYKNSASATQDNAYNRVNKIEIDYSDFNFSGVTYIVFAEHGGGNAENYTFGYSPEATGVNNNGTLNTHSLVTDFEVNKVIWTIGSLEGITTAEAGLYLDNGIETAEHSIDVEQFLANPSNYLITKFSISNRCTWDEDNNEWRPNASAQFCPCILFDSSETTGLYSLNQGPSGGATVAPSATGNLGFAGKFYAELWNNRQDNSTDVPAMNHPNKTFHRAFQNSYTLGSNNSNLVVEPKEDRDALTLACDLGTTGDFYVGYDELPNTSSYLQCYQHDKYTMVKDYSTATKSHLSSYRKYITTFLKGELVSKLIASCGVFFTQMTVAELNTAECTPTHMDIDGLHLGEMDDAGFTTGNWINGEDIADYDGINKDGSIIHGDFKPGPPDPEQNPWDVDPETYGWGGNNVGGMVRYYLLTKTQMENLVSAMGSSNNWVIDYLNNIVSCFIVPNNGIFFDAPVSTTVKFRIDNNTEWDTGVACKRISGVIYKSGGTIEIPHCTNTFLDFEPYSDYSVYIPFCGRIPIKGNVVCGREIKVTYYPDVPTCSVTAVVTCGDSTVAIAKGQFGSMIPVTSNGADRKTAAVISDVSNIITGLGMGIAGASTGNAGLLVAGGSQFTGGILNGAKDTIQSYAYSSGSSGDTSFFAAGTRCYYYANYLQLDEVVNNSIFGHTVGYLCNKVGTLSKYHGFTVCANPHINFSATSIEKEEIKRLLEEGVILP